jgi:hypothetical protein
MNGRCAQHGLRVAHDGRCLLCREPPRERGGRTLGSGLLVCVGTALALLVARPPAESTAPAPSGVSGGALRERTAAAHHTQHPDAPHLGEELTEELGPGAEDALLGPSAFGELVPRVDVRVPEPPRAPVEPEPSLPDDPRDFALR